MLCQSLNCFVFCAFWFMYRPDVNMSVSIDSSCIIFEERSLIEPETCQLS